MKITRYLLIYTLCSVFCLSSIVAIIIICYWCLHVVSGPSDRYIKVPLGCVCGICACTIVQVLTPYLYSCVPTRYKSDLKTHGGTLLSKNKQEQTVMPYSYITFIAYIHSIQKKKHTIIAIMRVFVWMCMCSISALVSIENFWKIIVEFIFSFFPILS